MDKESVRILCNGLLTIVTAILIYLSNNWWFIVMVLLGWQYRKDDAE